MRNIYHTDILLENTIRRLHHNTQIRAINKRLIFEYQETQIISEFSISHQYKCMNILTRIAIILDKPFKQVKQHDIVMLILWLHAQPLSNQTKADYKKVLKAFYKHLFPNRPKIYIKKIKPNSKNHTVEPIIFTAAQIRSFLNLDIQNRNYKCFLHILIWSGCRIGELLNLQPKDITIDNIGAILTVTGKTGTRNVRVYHCNDLLFNLIMTTLPDTYLFPKTPTHYNKLVSKWGLIIGIPKEQRIYPHLFRHTLFSFFINNGMSIPMAKKHFGWSRNSHVPESVYAHSSQQTIDSTILSISNTITE